MAPFQIMMSMLHGRISNVSSGPDKFHTELAIY